MKSFLVFPCKKNIVRLDRGFRPTSKRSWARDIKKLYGNKCLLTGAIASKEVVLEAHHIFCLKEYPALGFSLLNGVPLEKSVHRRFHRLYGLNASGKGPRRGFCFLNKLKKLTQQFYRSVKLGIGLSF